MWITGFDVPSCSTIYLDKPMRNHTLMQTIARANRVWRDKQNGLIVDYVGIFRDLQKALAIYGAPQGAQSQPIRDKAELASELRTAIGEARAFCLTIGVDVTQILAASGFSRERLKQDAVAAIVINDDTRHRYMLHANTVEKIFKSLLPDPAANEFTPTRKILNVLAETIRSEIPSPDISAVMDQVADLLDQSVAPNNYEIRATDLLDLSQVDFEALKRQFQQGRKPVEMQKLRGQVARKLNQMVSVNRTRMDYLEEFQKMVDEYNAGASNVETFFARLMAFTKKLSQEDKRAISEQLTEEELVIFDLLTKPAISLTKAEQAKVKQVAQALLQKLKQEKLVLDWKKKQTTRAQVRYTVEIELENLPRAFSTELYEQKCDAVYQHIFDSYQGSEQIAKV